MNPFLTREQLLVLRRCSGGLRVWEVGSDLQALLAELDILRRHKLVSFDERLGYEATPAGEAWLMRFDD